MAALGCVADSTACRQRHRQRARSGVPDIFDEVSDDLRADRTRQFLLRYAGAFVAAALLVLAGVGAYKAWQWHEQKVATQAATHYLAITDQIDAAGPGLTNAGRVTDATDLLNFAKTAPSGYAMLAQLRAAALYRDAGQLPKAQAIWLRVGGEARGHPMLRDLGNLLWAQSAVGTAPAAQITATLKPLMQPANPWHDLAQFDQAVLDLHQHQTASATALLQKVAADPATPIGLRNLAQGLLSTTQS